MQLLVPMGIVTVAVTPTTDNSHHHLFGITRRSLIVSMFSFVSANHEIRVFDVSIYEVTLEGTHMSRQQFVMNPMVNPGGYIFGDPDRECAACPFRQIIRAKKTFCRIQQQQVAVALWKVAGDTYKDSSRPNAHWRDWMVTTNTAYTILP